MTFSIITPSYRQFEWLELNSASVQDQQVDLEHIIQDAGSGKDLEIWASMRPRTKLFVESDAGMFDAINRGWSKASGEIIAQLNCDEQYLPQALERVKAFFDANPDVDVVYAAALIMDSHGTLRTYWKSIPLTATGVAAGGIRDAAYTKVPSKAESLYPTMAVPPNATAAFQAPAFRCRRV